MIHAQLSTSPGVFAISGTQGQVAVGAQALFFFHADVDDARGTGSIVFGGGIADDFDGFNAARWRVFQQAGHFFRRHIGLFAIDHDQNARTSFEGDRAVVVDHYARAFGQKFEGIVARSNWAGVYVDDHFILLQLNERFLSFNGYLAQFDGGGLQVQVAKVHFGLLGSQLHGFGKISSVAEHTA